MFKGENLRRSLVHAGRLIGLCCYCKDGLFISGLGTWWQNEFGLVSSLKYNLLFFGILPSGHGIVTSRTFNLRWKCFELWRVSSLPKLKNETSKIKNNKVYLLNCKELWGKFLYKVFVCYESLSIGVQRCLLYMRLKCNPCSHRTLVTCR